ncbi:hypothetical protein Slin15195_G114150 [Septoria linicola]|uniref:Uncharacterized protein n=1 Tax=Septoria linicola TaxID=215465 RepID=A0A9Q9ENS4_9PEZI|nr:hypothetical protein Slin14017_G112490 [Septoria linicola]USW58096.1 hypothetical protein Slin15195_G114150 [Septoria linicola]
MSSKSELVRAAAREKMQLLLNSLNTIVAAKGDIWRTTMQRMWSVSQFKIPTGPSGNSPRKHVF